MTLPYHKEPESRLRLDLTTHSGLPEELVEELFNQNERFKQLFPDAALPLWQCGCHMDDGQVSHVPPRGEGYQFKRDKTGVTEKFYLNAAVVSRPALYRFHHVTLDDAFQIKIGVREIARLLPHRSRGGPLSDVASLDALTNEVGIAMEGIAAGKWTADGVVSDKSPKLTLVLNNDPATNDTVVEFTGKAGTGLGQDQRQLLIDIIGQIWDPAVCENLRRCLAGHSAPQQAAPVKSLGLGSG